MSDKESKAIKLGFISTHLSGKIDYRFNSAVSTCVITHLTDYIAEKEGRTHKEVALDWAKWLQDNPDEVMETLVMMGKIEQKTRKGKIAWEWSSAWLYALGAAVGAFSFGASLDAAAMFGVLCGGAYLIVSAGSQLVFGKSILDT